MRSSTPRAAADSTPELPPLIRQMSRPSFYPHEVATGDVRLIQTHISYVLLAGDYAYKVKKPVDLGFLDFSTLGRRRHFCLEELRLNRRGAPELYLDVLPITEPAPGEYRLDGDGPPVEFVVRMRRFPQDALLVEQLRRGRLGEADVESLARAIAAYHATTAAAPPGFGGPEQVRGSVDDNYRWTQRFVSASGPQTPEQLRDTRAFTDGFFATRGDVLEERVTGGRIRECHGDLHLGNICRAGPGAPFLFFDCIEFNESFRYVDVMYDLAFPAMDLRAHGRGDLANGLVNTYAERTGDWVGLRVLPLYLCRQAYVRGKVNALKMEEQGRGEIAARDEALGAARRYFRLAWAYARPRAGRLLLTCGPSGSGKTTVARQLARRLDAVHIRSDAVRKHLAGVELDARGGPELYSAELTLRTYDRLLALGLALARDGQAVILDATYGDRELRTAAVRAAARAGVPAGIVNCVAPRDVMRERLIGRTVDIADASPAVLELQLRSYQPPGPDETPVLFTVDTTRPVAPQLVFVLPACGRASNPAQEIPEVT